MKIAIVFYSLYGNTAKLARAVAKGVEKAGGEAILRRVAETIPPETLSEIAKNPLYNKAQEEMADLPVATLEDLAGIDGLVLGSPCHFGNMSAQLKQYIDSTVPLWVGGKLAGKPAGVFTSSGSIHGGGETTLYSMLLPLLHHGMIIVGTSYDNPAVLEVGSPYGPVAVTGKEALEPPGEINLAAAEFLGYRVATVAQKLG